MAAETLMPYWHFMDARNPAKQLNEPLRTRGSFLLPATSTVL
jgi:hypothetical protein